MATILLVDDCPFIRLAVGRLLRDAGHETLLARHGEEALERLAESSPDMVLTDYDMPVMDGGVLTRRIRQLYPTVPVGMMSGQSNIASLVPEAQAHLVKSSDTSSILELVAKLQGVRDAWIAGG